MNSRLNCALTVAMLSLTASVQGQVATQESQDAESHVVRVSARALAAHAGLSLTPISDLHYGTFHWMELSDADLATLDAAGVNYTVRKDAFTLKLGEKSFDPVADGQPLEPRGLNQIQRDGDDMHLVQFRGPAKQEWLDDLAASGMRVVKYVHPHTYVVWGKGEQRNVINGNAAVRWTGEFKPAYRLLPEYRNLGERAIDVKAMVFRGSDVDTAVNAMADAGAMNIQRQVIDRTFEFVKMNVSGDALESIASIPGVYSVKPVPTDGGLRGEMFNQVSANNVNGANAAFPGYMTWLAGVAVDGTGVIIANVDSGIQDSHPDLAGQMLGCTGPTCGGSAQSGHGTHTAATMAGDGSNGATDPFGFNRGLGVAPGAKLVEQLYSPHFTEPGGMLKLMKDSYNNGADLSGNSWGPAGTPRGYDDDTYQVDVGVRDAVDDLPGNQPLTYVLSFMNGNGGFQSQGTPDEAKNIINVGSTKGQNGDLSQILAVDDLSANSAHGPALDGRTIPHMVAPGCQIDSALTGSSYGLNCGTSMASPHVSGAVALFIEEYRNLPDYTVDPSPAMVKAAVLAPARNLAGNQDADGGILTVYDSKQGYGRLDLEGIVDYPQAVRYFDNPQTFDTTGEEWTLSVSPEDPTQPMRLMLVWTDAPGHGLGGSTPAWNNNLDLIVEDGGTTYYGNNLANPSGWSVAGGSPDAINNTEAVFLGPTPPGAVTIRVVAADINSDGIPGVGDTTDQDFAFVCYNCAEEPGFGLASTPSAQSTCSDMDVSYTISTTQILGFTEAITLSASGLPAGAVANFTANPINPGDSSTLNITGLGGAAAGDYTIAIDGMSASLSRSTSAGLSVSTMIPGPPAISSPGNGDSGVSLVPTYTWTGVSQAAQYHIDIATTSSFGASIVESASVGDTTYDGTVTLNPSQTYFVRISASNDCGTGPVSPTSSFTTRDVPSILLVDDDDNSPNARPFYDDALTALGLDYDVWDTNNTDNEPALNDLNQYAVVIWFTGDEWGGAAGPGNAGEAALASWLDGGNKCLLLSSQDYYYDRGLTSFISGYLGVSTATSDVSQSSVTGQGSVFGGMGAFSLSFPFTNYSDVINPDGTAELAFSGSAGNAGVNKDTGTYRTTFLGFPLEALSMTDRMDVLSTAIDWCAPPPPPCPGDANGDLLVNFDDLNLILENWNMTVPTGTLGDVNDSGTVDFDDLNILLENWDTDCSLN